MISPVALALFATLFLIGYLPVQLLRSRSAALIAALVGLVATPACLWLLRTGIGGSERLAVHFYLAFGVIVGYGIVTGALARDGVLARAWLERRQARLITLLVGAGSFVLMLAIIRALGSG